MSTKTFSVMFMLNVDEENNMLSSSDEHHQEDVFDLITNVMYDVDDVTIRNLIVKERQ
jgi:hypothetical protein